MGEDSPDIESLRITREESRAVLDHQLSLLNDVDDKAMRTVRTAVIILGILVSAAGVAGIEGLGSLPGTVLSLFGAGAVALFLSAVAGVATYSTSDLRMGISGDHRREVVDGGYNEEEWLSLLLSEYSIWSEEMRSVTENNARWVWTCQVLLITALILLSVAGGLLWRTA